MMRSLQTGVTGLLNHQAKLEVIGNNIANLNTIGFKGNRISFADNLSLTLKGGYAPRNNFGGSNPIQFGLGMKVQSVDTNFNQGSLQSTGFATDLAINGSGFFTLRDGDDLFYSRAGNFSMDADGNLVAAGGSGVVQGHMADDQGIISSGAALEDVVLPLQSKIPAKATTEVTFYSNLDSSATMADATLVAAGESGASYVLGTANNGIGGTHSINFTGQNATQSSGAGATQGLTLQTVLSTAGVTGTDGMEVIVDNDTTYQISGISENSTVGDLINALNEQVNGATFELDGDGAIRVTRDFAGNETDHNVQILDNGTGNTTASIFGAATFDVVGGTDSTLIATDTFTNGVTNEVTVATLELITDSDTGLVNEIRSLGGGGVTVVANEGFNATPADPLVISTENTEHSTSIMIYDEMGNTHTMTMNFFKAGPNQWNWVAEMAEPAAAVSGNTGTVLFNDDGSLASFNFDDPTRQITINPGTEADDLLVSIEPGTIDGFDGITQTNSPFTTAAIGQDGYGMGTLQSIQIDKDGRIIGNYSNNVDQLLAEIVLANFNNPNGLSRAGDNRFAATVAAGEPTYGKALTNFGSTIESGYLELSNVDLVREFSEMITAQRAFQANARVITVTDQFLAEGTQLKR